MTLRFLAGAMGLPFVVTPSGLETDIVRKTGFSPEVRDREKFPGTNSRLSPILWKKEKTWWSFRP